VPGKYCPVSGLQAAIDNKGKNLRAEAQQHPRQESRHPRRDGVGEKVGRRIAENRTMPTWRFDGKRWWPLILRGLMTRVVCPDLVRLGFPAVHPTTGEVCDSA
jgi:hypothetical protein